MSSSEKGMVLYTSQKAEKVVGINSVFHGPTEWMIAKDKSILGKGAYKKEDNEWICE